MHIFVLFCRPLDYSDDVIGLSEGGNIKVKRKTERRKKEKEVGRYD